MAEVLPIPQSTDINLPADPLLQSQPISATLAGDLAGLTGSAKTMLVGSTLVSVGGMVAAVCSATIIGWAAGVVIGVIMAVVGGLIVLAGKLFGNKWHLSSKVRWLVQLYQFYVMGDPSATSARSVDERNIQECYNWFTGVLGVPIYDNLRVHALKGTDSNTGKPIEPRQSYHTRAINYLSYWEAVDVSYNNAYAAAQISDELEFNKIAGSWAKIPFAKIWFEKITVAELGENVTDKESLVSAITTSEGQSANPSIAIKQNLLAEAKNKILLGDQNKTKIIIASVVVLIIAFLFIFRKRFF